MLDAILNEGDAGFERMWPELAQQYGESARWQETYHGVIRKAVTTASMMVIASSVFVQYQTYQEKKAQEAEVQANQMIEQLENSTKKLQAENAKQAAAPHIGYELFDDWKASYEKEHGRAPTPDLAEYKEMHKFFIETFDKPAPPTKAKR